ncbi:hypothetical protein AOLI_G00083650 [Acnodon oligacanthus]
MRDNDTVNYYFWKDSLGVKLDSSAALAAFEAALPRRIWPGLLPALCWWRWQPFVVGLMWLVSVPIITNYAWLSGCPSLTMSVSSARVQTPRATFRRLSDLALHLVTASKTGHWHLQCFSGTWCFQEQSEGAQEEFGVEAGPRRRLLRDLQCDLPDPAWRLSQTSTVFARLDLCWSIHYSDMRNGYTRRLQRMEHRGLQQVTCLPHSTSVMQAKMRADSESLIKANQHQGVTAGLPEAPPCAV